MNLGGATKLFEQIKKELEKYNIRTDADNNFYDSFKRLENFMRNK